MAVLNARANTFLVTTGTTWTNTANAADGAYGVNSATYSVWTNTTANAVGTIEVGFGTQLSSVIPADAVLTGVSITLRKLVSQATRVPTVTFQPFDGSTAIGSPSAATISTSAVSDTAVFTPTLAQLRSANFKVRVSATRFNGTQAGTFSIDFVDIAVTYDLPLVERTYGDVFPVVDSYSTEALFDRDAVDIASMQDSHSAEAVFVRDFTDAVAMLDDVDPTSAYGRDYVDPVSLGDSLALGSIFNRDYVDLVPLFDLVDVDYSVLLIRDYSDGVGVSDFRAPGERMPIVVELDPGTPDPPGTPLAGRVNVKINDVWVEKPVTVRVNGQWVWKPVKVRTGGEWIRRR